MNIQSFIENTIDDVDYAKKYPAIDGRNNRTVYAYDAKGNLASTTDAIGAVTAYGYDVMGQTVTVTNALGNVTRYEYDLRGNKTYEGGATYPVRYAYDTFGSKTSMTTYRNEASGVGDTTTWTYDEASGVLLSKIYADGKGLKYTYTNDGKLATRTNARAIVTSYTYDAWGQLLSVDYADSTPDIAYTYDAMGRQTSATDAVGTTSFTYDTFGQLTAEQVSGLYSKTLTRHYDAFGRNVGYSVDGERKQSITYAPTTGRIAESDGFKWSFLPGTHLKSSLTYPNDAVVMWSYEPHRDLLTAVTNATYSTYVYTNDLLGRRTSKNDEQYSYNVRDELIAADEVSYNYDDIGNRTTAEGKTYTANNLNQYTAIDDFVPEYDADGNQTLIKTSTGIWSVTYNAENRPIRWESGDTVITMAFDRMGRRVEMRTVKNGEETLQRFVYDNYLCIQQLRTPSNTLYHSYLWDPTKPIATRPLVFLPAATSPSYYFHDGNKNVSDLVDTRGNIVHYDYSPFGTPTASTPSENPFRFSSEMYDVVLGLSYYNYRHYNPLMGRWNRRDPLASIFQMVSPYCFIGNSVGVTFDVIGLFGEKGHDDMPKPVETSEKDCPFPDFNEEDENPRTSPWLQPWRHFRPLEDSESDLGRAVSDCDVKGFESYAHQMQDYFSHYGQGYRWWLGGHVPDSVLAWLLGFANPDDLDDFKEAHEQAKERTQAWVNKWEKCCCCSSGKWVAKSGRDEGACGTGVGFPTRAAPPQNGLMPNIFPRSSNTNAPSILPPEVEVTFPIFDPNYRLPSSIPIPNSDWERGKPRVPVISLRF